MKKTTLALTLICALLLSTVAGTFFLNTSSAQSSQAITIKASGNVEGTEQLQRNGNVYTLTGNISGGIQVQRSNIIIDGAGYTVQGNGNSVGIDLWSRRSDPSRPEIYNVTIKNTRIINFSHGIDGQNSHNNSFIGNYITDCSVAIWLFDSENNTISLNAFHSNIEGIHLDYSGKNNVITENNLLNNDIDVYVFFSQQPIVDRNWWSNYTIMYPNAKEIGNTGVWDTPYSIWDNTVDSHPLVKWVSSQWLPDSYIMSFEEAIGSVSKQDFNLWDIGSGGQTGNVSDTGFVSESGIEGYLMWIAPNGTYFEAEYPSGKFLGEIGYLRGNNSLNLPTDGYYIWRLNYGDEEAFWVLGHNGTIVRYYPLRGSGPIQPFSVTLFNGVIVSAIVVVGLGLLVYLKKRRRAR